MLLAVLAYSLLLLCLLNANYLYGGANSVPSLFSFIVVKIIPWFVLVCGLTGSRTCQVLPKVTVLTVLAWVSLRWDFHFCFQWCPIRQSDMLGCLYIRKDRIIIQRYYQEVIVMLLNKLSAVVSIKELSFGAIQIMEHSSIALLLNKIRCLCPRTIETKRFCGLILPFR